MTEPSRDVLEPRKDGPDFTLCRGCRRYNKTPVRTVAVTVAHPWLQRLRWLDHEFSPLYELDAARATKAYGA